MFAKTKQLTNHRASSGEELVQLQAPVDMSLERALGTSDQMN